MRALLLFSNNLSRKKKDGRKEKQKEKENRLNDERKKENAKNDEKYSCCKT